MIDKDKREFGGWWVWILVLVVISAIAFFGLRAAGIIGGTVLEREVFKRSYQRTEGLKSQIATYEAQLAQLRVKLGDPNLEPGVKRSLQAQKAAIEVQLASARSQQGN
jgi:hypothetical protein